MHACHGVGEENWPKSLNASVRPITGTESQYLGHQVVQVNVAKRVHFFF